MRVLFIGSTSKNIGPDNVNRKIVEHWPNGQLIKTVHAGMRIAKVVETFCKGLRADVIVSASGKRSDIAVIGALVAYGKPLVCFNHGYAPFENDINNLGYSQKRMESYRRYLDSADLVVANSRCQMEHLGRQQPSLKTKLTYVNNATEPFEQYRRRSRLEQSIKVAVSGGTRPIKGNEVVAEAVCLLIDSGKKCMLSVYGDTLSVNERLSKAINKLGSRLIGQISQGEFHDGLRQCNVFVMNSRHEPFGLSVLDALEEGVSVLVSDNCGIADILALEENDRIHDCEDVDEIARKISYLVVNPNAERIYRAIDFEKLNWKSTSLKLFELTRGVLEYRREGRVSSVLGDWTK